MKKELATLRDHGIVVLALIAIEWGLKGALHYAGEWGYVPMDTVETASQILDYFMIVGVLVFCITGLICLIKNSHETIRKQ